MAEKLSDYKFRTPIHIRFSDIDAVGHANNAVYLTYFEIARFNYWRDVAKWDFGLSGIIVGRTEVNYLKPVLLHDTLMCYARVVRIGNSSFDMMHILVKVTDKGEEICTTSKAVCISYDYKANKSVPIPNYARNRMIEHD